ncbi:glycosyltransferase family 2 protein [Martelella radicis]|uniref:Cellulose synthase/poly-beta-1,6-N-acetylglucosamine synthase-like glycosyltransferase n=1 Tax=Martelella radicis TaxID=1397476 RepID=A0A7W6KKS1_9HYPH|nr:glycosyltransferase family 2 protein [Martelella radicis]MBB4123168.1 cellulose synthase/poly-beta-1,6-N-acetylglucosamine synthase-like glycosyltransferase [Martelella radicis]
MKASPLSADTRTSPKFSARQRWAATDPLAGERRMLRRLGFNDALIESCEAAARRNGTTIEDELLAEGSVVQETYYRRLASYLGLPFTVAIDAEAVADRPKIDRLLAVPSGLRIEGGEGGATYAIIPRARDLADLHRRLSGRPAIRRAVVVTMPSTIRKTVWEVGAARRLAGTIHRLMIWEPRFSARIVFWGKQGFLLGGGVASFLAGLALFTAETLLLAHILFSALYALSLLIRLAAVRAGARPEPEATEAAVEGPVPVYTVLVALYREANMIPQLVEHMKKLNWPASRLDIKLVCEADDSATMAAIEAETLPAHFELVRVPPALPRTKPKALNYALSGARGTYLTIYDAEDRPHPDQLREAWQTFSRGPATLGCLQAPLVVGNIGQNWISALFACEYAGLFRGILPFLARHRFPLPLGGTSNHFRTEVLRRCRAWDPYNVAEDADLGLRLHRLGYHCGVIGRPTLEDAPETVRAWISQRSRWIKGWLQTLLVALREPSRLFSELGTLGALVFLANGAGVILSSLLHPLLFVALAMTIAAIIHPDYNPGPLHQMLSGLDLANILASYWVFLRLGLSRMEPDEARQMRADALYLPFYWLMLSAAAWKAFAELYHAPFLWRKTAHRPNAQRPG